MKKLSFIATILLFIALFASACSPDDSPSSTPPPSTTGTVYSDEELAMYEQQALILTEHFIIFSFHVDAIDNTPADREIFDFMVTLPHYDDELSHPYHNLYYRSDDETQAIYPLQDVQLMVYELFGINNWVYLEIPSAYSDGDPAFIIPLEIGSPVAPFSLHDATVSSSPDGTVTVDFMLTNTLFFEADSSEYGLYRVTFSVVEEDGRHFLRFIKYGAV